MDAPVHFQCGKRHWSGDECKLPDVTPRPWIREFLGGGPVAKAKPVTVAKPRTKTAHRPVAVKTAHSTCDCGAIIPRPERGPMPKFCSNKCRMRASRKKEPV